MAKSLIPPEDRWMRRDGKGLLSEDQQHRYMRQGWTKARYDDPTKSLANARGHGSKAKENVHAEQLRLLRRYGPTDSFGEPRITLKDLQEMRKSDGDRVVTELLRNMERNFKTYMAGGSPYKDDPSYPGKSLPKDDLRAPWYWYHGRFGA
jgi:hypothetical protein